MKYKFHFVFPLAVLGGILLAFAYVNPYSGKILLSELVLQISGSRGEFALGFSMSELVSLLMRMIPVYIFEIYFGTALYRHFCTASIYVFSRYPKRLHWYFGEVLSLGVSVCLYQIVLLTTIIFTTMLRYQIQLDEAGTALLVYHLSLNALWLYSITLIVNLLAIRIGSSASFLIVFGIQIICITLLGCLYTIPQFKDIPPSHQGFFLSLNPISHLVLGWHSSHFGAINQVLNPPYPGLYLGYSMLLISGFCIITILLGGIFVKSHDLLVSDSEMGGL